MSCCDWKYVAEVKSDTGRRFQILTDTEVVAYAVAKSLGGYHRELGRRDYDDGRVPGERIGLRSGSGTERTVRID